MNIYPKPISNEQLKDSKGKYTCHTCQSSNSDEAPGPDWFECPMVRNREVCDGCCADYQSVVRSESWQDHSYYDVFVEEVLRDGHLNDEEARATCLQHQKELLEAKLKDPRYQRAHQAYQELLDTVLTRIST